MTKEAMKQALEALKKARRKILTTEECHATITILDKALKQDQGEPVVYCEIHHLTEPCVQCTKEHEGYKGIKDE